MAALAPIVLFCYNRPRHTEQTLTALSQNLLADESELFVFCDGPKPDADEAQKQKIEEVRRIVKSKNWCGKVTVFESEFNKGLANSVIEGVTRIVNQYGRIIVLEDDLITSKYFLEYMNTALEKYKDEEKVMQVSGHQFPIGSNKNNNDTYFLPFTTSWGWATWKRAWGMFDPKAKGYERLAIESELRKRFNIGCGEFFSKMIVSQMDESSIDSWAIRWYWSVFINDGIVLFPTRTLVKNFGSGEEATHTQDLKHEDEDFSLVERVVGFPAKAIVESKKYSVVLDYFDQIYGGEQRIVNRGNFLQRLIHYFVKKGK